MLQRPVVAAANESESESEAETQGPFLVPLRRESVPIYRQGKVASFKTSYSGVLNLGTPMQEFRVVFDTGSGHLVLPAAECKSEACMVADRRKFNMSLSSTSVAINSDGSPVPKGEFCDQVTIGFGTGEITGEFTRDIVCFNKDADAGTPALAAPAAAAAAAAAGSGEAAAAVVSAVTNASGMPDPRGELCVEMSVILAVEMSTQPFKTFRFDGILGLGLDALALNKGFSFFDTLLRQGLPASQFAIFLTEGEDNEESEVAFGGYDKRRMLHAPSWVPVVMAEHGHWQVAIAAIRIGGVELDVCKDGTCRGVVDTGTSHLGIPAPFDKEVSQLLTREAGDLLDCRWIDAPEVEIELEGGIKLSLEAWNYMRRLPLREDISVGSERGVTVQKTGTTDTRAGPAADVAAPAADGGSAATSAPAPAVEVPPSPSAAASAAAAPGPAPAPADAEPAVRRFCRPRLLPVRLPAPLGPKLFILGEPVLHRYYTAYDWEQRRVGFSLANNRRNTMSSEELSKPHTGTLPQEVEMLLLQQSVQVSKGAALSSPSDDDDEPFQEETVFLQVKITTRVQVKMRPRVV